MYVWEDRVEYKYLYGSCITIKSSHSNGASGDRAAYRELDRVLLQLVDRARAHREETINE